MRLGILAYGLGITFTVGCSSQSGTDINPMSRDDAMASAKRVSGSTLEVCTDIGYLDTDGVTMVYAQVSGYSADGDDFAVVPSNWSDIFEDQQYYCGFDGTPIGYIAIASMDEVGLDCDDTDAEIGEAGSATYGDNDGDGFGAGTATMVCTLSEGDITDNTDCDDTEQYTFPGAAELESSTACMADTDSDGYGDDNPASGITAGTDCDDETYAVNPAATEVCDDVDNDCSGSADDGLAFTDYYPDGDVDGYGAGTASSECADPGEGFSALSTDCDDGNSGINPGATEMLDNAVDEDCSGTADMTPTTGTDADADGYDSIASGGEDCNDSDSAISPGATDVDNDGLDNNCDGIDTEWFCLTGTEAVGSDIISLYTLNYTENWWELPFTGSSGYTTVCSSEEIVVGDEQKANGEVAGSATYWLVMLDSATVPNHIETVSIAGVSFTIGGVDPGDDVWTTSAEGLSWMLHPWSYTGSAPWDGRDLILVIPTTPS